VLKVGRPPQPFSKAGEINTVMLNC